MKEVIRTHRYERIEDSVYCLFTNSVIFQDRDNDFFKNAFHIFYCHVHLVSMMGNISIALVLGMEEQINQVVWEFVKEI